MGKFEAKLFSNANHLGPLLQRSPQIYAEFFLSLLDDYSDQLQSKTYSKLELDLILRIPKEMQKH